MSKRVVSYEPFRVCMHMCAYKIYMYISTLIHCYVSLWSNSNGVYYVFISIVQFDAIDNDGNTNDIMYVKSL